jgi:hypothetical protein
MRMMMMKLLKFHSVDDKNYDGEIYEKDSDYKQ